MRYLYRFNSNFPLWGVLIVFCNFAGQILLSVFMWFGAKCRGGCLLFGFSESMT